MKKLLISLLVGTAFALSLCVYASSVQNDISKNVIRLHVIANSDSEFDQSVKLEVKDEITKYLSPLLANSKSVFESETVIKNSVCEIEKIAENVLERRGAPYKAKASLSLRDFPTKRYSNVTLPAGTYKALCIDLGSACGQNWWCVMFPPLCLNSSTLSMPENSKNYLKENLNEDSFAIVNTNEDEDMMIVYRFKIFDYISSVKSFGKNLCAKQG